MTFYPKTSQDIDRGLVGYWPLNDLRRVSSDGIVAHFKLNDNAADTVVIDSKSGNNGVCWVNTDTIDAVGQINGALTFTDSADERIELNNPEELQLGNRSQSIFAWVKLQSTVNAGYIYTSRNDTAGELSFLVVDNGTLLTTIGQTGQTAISHTSVFTDTWTHIGVVYDKDAGTLTYYVDNSVVGTDTSVTGTWDTSVNKGIGTRLEDNGLAPKGLLDDVRIYDRALSTAEINTIYNGGAGIETTELFRETIVARDLANFNDGTITGCTNSDGINGLNPDSTGFDGVDDYINTSEVSADLIDTSKPFTFSMWVSPEDNTSFPPLISIGDGNTRVALAMRLGGQTTFEIVMVNATSTIVQKRSTSILTLSDWNHLVGVWDGSTAEIFLDGEKITTLGIDTNTYSQFDLPNTELNIATTAAQSVFMQGNLQKARVYNRALTSGEVNKLYRLKK